MRIRKVAVFTEEIRVEGTRPLDTPLTMVTAAAVIANPFAGQFVEDLGPLVDEYSNGLGELLSQRAVAGLPRGAESVESFGKGGLVGLDGEIEHSTAIIHTLKFGTPIRDLVSAKNLLVGCDKRGSAGTSLDIPMIHKSADKARGHYMTHEIRVPDGPRPDEILIAFAVSDGPRPHPRSGGAGKELGS